jgi:glyoxylase-like metal-dependent hydrolase (beta-lactamase superfamily II)
MSIPERSLHGEAAHYKGGVHPVADGSVAYLQPNGGLGEANVGVVLGDDSTLIIDTCWDHKQARRMLDAIGPHIKDRPISTVINTHSNGDHWWGNALMPADAQIITSKASLDAMNTETPFALGCARAALKVAASLPLPGMAGRSAREGYHEFKPFDFFGVRRRYPDTTFRGQTEITVGGRKLELLEVGPAHTPGDLMVFDHEAGVVFGGDILFIEQTPIMWEGPARNWIHAIEAIERFSPEGIVPGHGPLTTIEQVANLRTYFEWVEAGAKSHRDAGTPAADAALIMVQSEEFAGSPWAKWGRPEILAVTLATEYQHLAGKHKPPNQIQMVGMMSSVRTLGEKLGGHG